MGASEKRKTIYVQVTERSQENWRSFAEGHGVSLASVIEALGRQIADLDSLDTEKLIRLSRTVDAQRRRRKTN